LIRRGAFAFEAYFYATLVNGGMQCLRCLTHLKVGGTAQQRWVEDHRHVDNVVEGEVKDIATSEAVADPAKLRDALSLQGIDDFVEVRTRLSSSVRGEPLLEVEAL
jgi:hypothetical protein